MKIIYVLLGLVISCALYTGTANAQVNRSALPVGESGVPDVRVIIDISGSMKQNDPQNLRRPALELLVRLFPEGSKAGVWTFGQWVNMLVSHKPVTAQWRKDGLNKANKINSVALFTNIPEALIKATDDIDHLQAGYKTSLILLTDGVVDISKLPDENNKARQRIIDEIIPRLRKAGITVHTIALSKNADQELMERLAVETNGLTAIAETAEDLTQIFLQAFDAAIPAEQVPLESNTFLVDSSIEEYTALVFRKAGSKELVLVSPDGKNYTRSSNDADIRWYSQSNYDLITVKRPYEGPWSIIADLEPNSRVTIVSNLSLQVTALAKSIFVDGTTNLSAMLQEKGKAIVNPKLLNLIDMSVEIKRRSDGYETTVSLLQTDPVSAKGVFTSVVDRLKETGVYDITVKANGKTFQRQHRQTVQVRESFTVSTSTSENNPPNHEVTLFAVDPAIEFNSANVVAYINLPNGSNDTQSLTATSARNWKLPIQGLEQPGVYTVTFDVSGQYQDGRPFRYQSTAVTIEHIVAGSQFVPQPEPLTPPTPEPITPPKPEPTAPVVPEPEVKEEHVEEAKNWKNIITYIGIAIGNLLVFMLGYYVYRMITTKSGSDILDSDDDIEIDGEDENSHLPINDVNKEPEPGDVEELDTALLSNEEGMDDIDVDLDDSDLDDIDIGEDSQGAMLDLPDDAIDIDPSTDEDNKI